MAGIVLIHGAWFGGWVWHRMSPILRKMGHTVVDEDMPGTGQSRAEKEKNTMQDQLDHLEKWSSRVSSPVHLVAHAMAGIIGTEFTERYPHRVRSITYISSLFGAPGEAAITMPYARKPDSRLKFTEQGDVIPISSDGVAKLAFSDCTPEDFKVFANKVEDISWDPPMLPLEEKTGHWRKIQRGYIICQENPFVFLAQQHQMTIRHKCSPIVKMNTGHCPFLTRPRETAEIIDEIISQVEPADGDQPEHTADAPVPRLKVVK